MDAQLKCVYSGLHVVGGGQGRGGLSLRQRGTPLGRMSLLVLLSQAAKSQRPGQLLAREPRLLPFPSLPGLFLS